MHERMRVRSPRTQRHWRCWIPNTSAIAGEPRIALARADTVIGSMASVVGRESGHANEDRSVVPFTEHGCGSHRQRGEGASLPIIHRHRAGKDLGSSGSHDPVDHLQPSVL